jgi:hypothetical protein
MLSEAVKLGRPCDAPNGFLLQLETDILKVYQVVNQPFQSVV